LAQAILAEVTLAQDCECQLWLAFFLIDSFSIASSGILVYQGKTENAWGHLLLFVPLQSGGKCHSPVINVAGEGKHNRPSASSLHAAPLHIKGITTNASNSSSSKRSRKHSGRE